LFRFIGSIQHTPTASHGVSLKAVRIEPIINTPDWELNLETFNALTRYTDKLNMDLLRREQ
jgi:hypothetical protein